MNDTRNVLYLIQNYNTMFRTIDTLSISADHISYLQTTVNNAATLRKIAASGDFAECLTAVETTLDFDAQYLAKTDTDRAHVLASRKSISQGKHHYEMLTKSPKTYRRFAEGFVDRDRLSGGMPNDGMHKALSSHLGHLRGRYSIMLSLEERDFLEAQIELVAAMIKIYAGVQKGIMKAKKKKKEEQE